MLRKTMLFAYLFLCSALVMTAAAQKVKDKPATSTIKNQDGTNTDFRIMSDSLGTYTNSTTVLSIIKGIGDWELDTNYLKPGSNTSGSTRYVRIDFSDPASPSPPNSPSFATTNITVPAEFLVQCSQRNYNHNMLTMAVGPANSVTCPLYLNFDYQGISYAVAMHNNIVLGGYIDAEPVTITCTGAIGSQCSSWTIEPTGLVAGGKNVGKLLEIEGKNNSVSKVLGNYYFTFDIRVTTP